MYLYVYIYICVNREHVSVCTCVSVCVHVCLCVHVAWHQVAWHQSLTTINLCDNRFTKFPEVLTRLVTLCDIDISDNKISVVPTELYLLTRLTTFRAARCPLSSPSAAVVADGVEAYLVLGSLQQPAAMGMYRKTLESLNGRPGNCLSTPRDYDTHVCLYYVNIYI